MILSPKEADKKTNVIYFKPRKPIHPEDYLQGEIENDLRKSTHVVFIETRGQIFDRYALSLMFLQAKKGGPPLRITRIRSMKDYAKLSLTLINKELPVPIVVLGKSRDLCIRDALEVLEYSLNIHLVSTQRPVCGRISYHNRRRCACSIVGAHHIFRSFILFLDPRPLCALTHFGE